MYYYPLHRYLVTRDYEICLFYGKPSIPCFFRRVIEYHLVPRPNEYTGIFIFRIVRLMLIDKLFSVLKFTLTFYFVTNRKFL